MKKVILIDGNNLLFRSYFATAYTGNTMRNSKGFPTNGLYGLVNMLKNLEDASTIGPNMAVALITTLYGSLIANWLCAPFANKLKANNAIEVTLKTIIIEGLLSIQAGENPRVIEEKLKSFLAPSARIDSTADGGGEE